jgi:DNA topoisomerase-1
MSKSIKNLVIVESPAKAKTIEGYLGKDWIVKSSQGHIRDLPSKKISVDVANNFNPEYAISEKKTELVKELKKFVAVSETVWLATDEDREGEAISWHLAEALGLDSETTNRIVFNEITKKAILKAIEAPRTIDMNLVNAQQARRILDRLVGYELSPILQRQYRKQSLSAGRVQSVAVRLVVERENEILSFAPKSSYKVNGFFFSPNGSQKKPFRAELEKKLPTLEEAQSFLERCKNAAYTLKNLDVKPKRSSAPAPFTTSTLQQEASRKLGFSITQTMQLAQKLYEEGYITYMRTDSVNLSETAIAAAEEAIKELFGNKYSSPRNYTTKSSSAQEAHEAIRPTNFKQATISAESRMQKLYSLIWKRAVASQMSDAEIEKTVATIAISTTSELFEAIGEVLLFDGFKKLYIDSSDDEDDTEEDTSVLPILKLHDILTNESVVAEQVFTKPSARYTEASLVKKLEELGIGRPSTYAPTIKTVLEREYVVQEDRAGKERMISSLLLKNNTITSQEKPQLYGTEKKKLFPTDLGIIITDYLIKNFPEVMDYNFTATVEEEFDSIATGKTVWFEMIGEFYSPFKKTIEKVQKSSERVNGERLLGTHPSNGRNIYARFGKNGAYVQIGENDDEDKSYASLRPGQSLPSITLEEAIQLFILPRIIGEYEESEVKIGISSVGPYVLNNKKFYTLPPEFDPYTVTYEEAITVIEQSRLTQPQNTEIKTFAERPDVIVKSGRYGPYIAVEKVNVKIPKDKVPAELTLEECLELYEAHLAKPPSAKYSKATTTKAKTTKAKKK